MASAFIKFYNPEYLISDSIEQLTTAVRSNEFQSYTIKTELNKIIILENQNKSFCSLLFNSCFLDLQDFEIRVYSRAFETQESPLRQEDHLIMEIKLLKSDSARWIAEQFRQHERIQKFRGPLSYEPIRQERASILSSESTDQNFRGFLNLGILFLILNHIRLIVENFLKYGLLLRNFPFLSTWPKYRESPIFITFLIMIVSSLIAFLIQKLAFKNKLSPRQVVFFYVLLCQILVWGPVYVLQASHPSLNLVMLGGVVITLLKIISYAHTMRNIKQITNVVQKIDGKKVPVSDFFNETDVSEKNLEIIIKNADSPHKLVNFRHFIYFMLVPTYCFQLYYPRTKRIRKFWIVKRVIEFILILLLWIVVWYQYVEPLLNNTYIQFKRDNERIGILLFAERIMKLAIPNTYLWLLFFYLEFQLRYNILAELLRFGDRQFYLDWWNCKNIGEYWRLWNLPIHHWLTRHLYFPLLKHGYRRWKANLIVFLISAIAHEFIMSASLGVFECWAFLGMLLQAPMIYAQDSFEKIFKLQSSQLGNAMFWILFCFFGQPLLIFLYYFQFLEKQE